jgi:glycine oxidase
MKIVIVGGGLIGLSIAWQAAQRGLEAVLVDSPSPNAASRVGAGLLIPAGGRISLHHLALKNASAQMFPKMVGELEDATGLSCGFNPCGTMTVAFEPGADDSIDGMVSCLRGLGVQVERLSGEECRLREPALSEAAAAGYYKDDHQVDPEKLGLAFREAGRRLGVQFLDGLATRVEARKVQLDTGETLEADRIVVTAGAWLKKLLSLNVHPVKGEVIHLSGAPGILNHNLVLRKEDIYIANRGDGRYVVGATAEEVGFDTSVTATTRLRKMAEALVPGLRACELGETRVGFRPKVGDGLPLLGEYDGLVAAGAHYRNGILLAPITGRLIADYLVTNEVPELMKPFDPNRDCRHRDEKRP